jgi:hypothetical protein
MFTDFSAFNQPSICFIVCIEIFNYLHLRLSLHCNQASKPYAVTNPIRKVVRHNAIISFICISFLVLLLELVVTY